MPLLLVLTTLSLALLVLGQTATNELDTCYSYPKAWMMATLAKFQDGLLDITVATRQSMEIIHSKTQDLMVSISGRAMHGTDEWIRRYFICSGKQTDLATTRVALQELLNRISSDLMATASVAFCTALTITSWLLNIRPIFIEGFTSGIVGQAPFIAHQIVNLLYMTIIYIGGKLFYLACLTAFRVARFIVSAATQMIPFFIREPWALSILVMTWFGILLAFNNLEEAAVSDFTVQNSRWGL